MVLLPGVKHLETAAGGVTCGKFIKPKNVTVNVNFEKLQCVALLALDTLLWEHP